MRARLPIDDVLPELLAALRGQTSVVLHAPTGAGKTTRVPTALLDAGFADQGQILLLEPRRLAARAAAARMAQERASTLGDEIGYAVRFDQRASRRTRVLVCSEGILLRRLQDDPLLDGIAGVVFDEFHERSLASDLTLALCRRVQSEVRPDLRLVVMSATLAAAPIARYLGDCPVVASAGRLHPVEIVYEPHESLEPVPVQAAAATRRLSDATAGDLLVFLPGVGEIRRTADELRSWADSRGYVVLPLFGDMSLDEQQRVLNRCAERKIVLATNVAETSLTIDGVTGVVDTGWARVLRLDATLGLNRLELERIARSNAEQRAGRAGRTAPGVCHRLWTERQHQALAEFATPEIQRVDLAGPALELLCWGERDLPAFPWYERPPAAALDNAVALLRRLGALDGAGPSALGRQLVRLPVHPRLGRLLVAGHQLGDVERVALAAALLSERDPVQRGERRVAEHRSTSDVLDRVHALEEFAARRGHSAGDQRLDAQTARFTLRAAEQLARAVRSELGAEPAVKAPDPTTDARLEQAVFTAFADRVCRRRAPRERRALMVGGRGVRLDERSAVTEAELFVAVELTDSGGSESLVRLASAVERSWLPPVLCNVDEQLRFDEQQGRVVAVRVTRYEDLPLGESVGPAPRDERTAQLLAAQTAGQLQRVLPDDPAVEQRLARLRSLRGWLPELNWPDLSDEALEAHLPELCACCTSWAEVRRGEHWHEFLGGLLTAEQWQALDRDAPETLAVPSGSRIKLHYEPGKPPVLAVRIQEIFGLLQTPRIARGRVAVLLHLLAPNYRPQQVTQDLASFWAGAYHEVRKELKRRYPKHAWPEDPHTATAERRPGRPKT